MWKSMNYASNRMDEMIEMTIENYGEDNDISKREFIEHEYFQNPSGDAFIKLAYDEENAKLAGQYIVIPMNMHIEGKEYPVILSLNTLTRKEYRGQKIFTSLAEEVYAECTQKGYRFCYGAPNPNSHHNFVSRMGFRDIGIMPLYLKVIHPSLLAEQKFRMNVMAVLAKPFDLLVKKKKMQNEYEVVLVEEDNIDSFDEFWTRIKTKYPVMGVRNAKFMKWRYLRMPERQYRIYAIYNKSRMQGYIIGRITEVAGIKCGMVVDFLVAGGNEKAAEALLMKIQGEFYRQGVGLMGCLMQKSVEEAGWLKKEGFFICPKFMEPQPFPIIYKELNRREHNEVFEDFRNWFFTMGDYDVI